MSDLNPAAWVEMILALPLEVRERKARVQAAALAEVGLLARPDSSGGVRYPISDPTEAHCYRAHELSCQAVGIPSLPLEGWRVACAIPITPPPLTALADLFEEEGP